MTIPGRAFIRLALAGSSVSEPRPGFRAGAPAGPSYFERQPGPQTAGLSRQWKDPQLIGIRHRPGLRPALHTVFPTGPSQGGPYSRSSYDGPSRAMTHRAPTGPYHSNPRSDLHTASPSRAFIRWARQGPQTVSLSRHWSGPQSIGTDEPGFHTAGPQPILHTAGLSKAGPGQVSIPQGPPGI